MAKFFKDGFSKLHGVLNAPPRPPAASEPDLPAYNGKLSASHFSLSQGGPLGLGAVVPKTLAHEPRAQLIGISASEGHVHLFGQDLELCLKNPAAPVQPEFLLFPRPGLLLAFGVGLAGSSTTGWIAQWWDLRSGRGQKLQADAARAPAGVGAPQLLALRFSVMCTAISQEDAPLVFLGTDEGDVRVFDAGETPRMGAYCIPWDRLVADGQGSSRDVIRPCPVMALAAAPPHAGAELLVGGAEGNVVLWSFERNRAIRTFQAPGTVSSLIWHAGGASFLASSRAEIALFSKSNSTALARVPMPGGPASSVTLLRWCDVSDNVDDRAPKTSENPIHGEVLLRRGAPGPAVLNLWGPEWAQVDDLLAEADNPVTGGVLCLPARINCGSDGQAGGGDTGLGEDVSEDASFGTMAVPCGCMAPPLSVIMQGAVKRSVILERLAAAPVLLAALGDPGTRLVVSTVPPMRKLAWPATWGSLELVGTTALCLVPKEAKPLQWPPAAVDNTEGKGSQTAQTSAGEGAEVSDEVAHEVAPCAEEQTVKTPAAAAEALFARRFANFSGFVAGGYELDPEPWHFVELWSSMVGGWQGLLCSGHRDGKVRIWLRGHSTVLLLHTLSVRPQVPLPWRPQLTPCEDADARARLRDVQRVRWYDGVDACPAVALPEEDAADAETAWPWQITAIVFEPGTGALLAGTGNGSVFLFRWRDSPSPLSLSEHAEWKAHALLPVASGSEGVQAQGAHGEGDRDAGASLPLLPGGLACVLRLRQHVAAVKCAQLTSTTSGHVYVASLDTTSLLCIADADSGCVLFRGSIVDSVPAQPMDSAPVASAHLSPPASIEAMVLADHMMRASAVAAEQTKGVSPKHELMESEPESDTYILAVSNGDLRQLTATSNGAQLLDGRIRETRLPGLPGGPVLLMELARAYLLVVQTGAAHVLVRPTDSELAPPQSVPFAAAALSAGLLDMEGEPCLCVLFASLDVHMLAIPSLRTLKKLSAGEQAAPFLGLRGSGPDAFFSSDGYFVLRRVGPEGIRLWLASVSAGASAFDEAACMLPAASIAQACGPCKGQSSPTAGRGRAANASFGASLFSGLFGGGGPRSLRECVAPVGHSSLPSEVDAANVDRQRGLAPAWRDPNERPPPPPPPPAPRPAPAAATSRASRPASAARSSASSARNPAAAARNLQGMQGELAQANARAMERGEKLGEMANKSQKLADDSANFLKMAQQLNARQSSWF